MNKTIFLTIILVLIPLLYAQTQENEIQNKYILKLNGSYLYIDNSKKAWFTLELKTDTMFHVENNMYFFGGKTIQINSIPFNTGKAEGIMGSINAEKNALIQHKKWELNYQKKTLGVRIKANEEFYFDRNGKPFLIWWYKTPKSTKVPLKQIELNLNQNPTKESETILGVTEQEFDVTQQLFLDFTVWGNRCISVSIPVLGTETLEKAKIQLREIANSVNVYGSYIDLGILSERRKKVEKYIYRDTLNLISLELPDWANVIQSPRKDVLILTFPEKENIYNAASILATQKTDSLNFQQFINRGSTKSWENTKIIIENDSLKRVFYMKNNSEFYCQNVYLKGKSGYCFVNFTATPTTYEYNLNRFNELIDKLKLE